MDLDITDDERAMAHATPAGLAWLDGGRSKTPHAGWFPAKHLQLIAHHLVRAAAKADPLDRLGIFTPPRHGKSQLCSRYFPAWYLGQHPDNQVILASYAAELAAGHSRAARTITQEWGPDLYGVNVDPSSGAAHRWQLDGRKGIMVAAGVGGGITGRGADLAVVDDPVKDQEEAASETIRERNWNWYQSTLLSRLHPGAALVLIQTRWHEDDLAGRILREHGDRGWTILNLPAVCEDENDPLGRGVGEALWAARYDQAALERLAMEVGVYWWAALYQQRPMPAGGLIFQRDDFRYFSDDEDEDCYLLAHTPDNVERFGKAWCYHFATIDSALSEKETADFTVVCRWAVTPNRDLLLLDVERHRFDQPGVEQFVIRTCTGWGLTDWRVETKAAGLALFQSLKRGGHPIRQLDADTDKVTRAMGAVPRYEAHAVFHRSGAPWMDAYERELLAFPNGTNDDQVDCFSYAALALPGIPVGQRRRQGTKPKTAFHGLRSDDM